jgi:hypothetical protein
MPTSRRTLLCSAAGLAGGLAVSSRTTQARPTAPALPTVKFGGARISRLVCGANQLYGYSHFNWLLSTHMKEWMTPDRRVEILQRCEQNGINTWQLHYQAEAMDDLKRYRDGGGSMNVFFLSMGAMHTDEKAFNEVIAVKPVGIAHHGNRTDDLFREGRMAVVQEFLKKVRDAGVMVGLSCHNPNVIDYVEEKGWDIDYYMTCFYRVSRTHEESVREFGEAPLGETVMERDPERMTARVRQTRKPCLGFKILAAGRKTDKPEQVAAAFDYALGNIKETDAVIVGMYPRYRDEVTENANHIRRIHDRMS